MPAKKTLTNESYWSGNWQGLALPVTNNLRNYARYRLDRLFRRHLPKGRKSILEVGCCPGSWLDYFRKQFDYRVSGVEYAENGYKYTLANLKYLNVKADIRHEDVFKTTFLPNSFDIVFSHGVIEHFTDPMPMINAHLKLLKSGGLLIIGVPNVGSPFYRKIQSWYSKDILESHVLTSGEWLKDKLDLPDLELVYCDYVGTFSLFLINTSRSPKFVKIVTDVVAIILNRVLLWTKIDGESRIFSPYIYYIGRKI